MPRGFRHEYKYLCTNGMLAVEQARLSATLRTDPHAGSDGSYLVRSVYFDDPDSVCYYENEDGEDPRAKYRVRIYNVSDDFISLERKAKSRTMTHKDQVRIGRPLADELLLGRIPFPSPSDPPLLRRMLTDMRLRALAPSVIVQYVRTPFILPQGDVRVTLDRQICSSHAVRRFFTREIPTRPILRDADGILEVKWDCLLPDWLKSALELDGLQWSAFSKYYYCRRFNVNGGTDQ